MLLEVLGSSFFLHLFPVCILVLPYLFCFTIKYEYLHLLVQNGLHVKEHHIHDVTHLVVVDVVIFYLPNSCQIRLFIYINRTITKDLHTIVMKSELIHREISVSVPKKNFFFWFEQKINVFGF